jgi:hypothetical protein
LDHLLSKDLIAKPSARTLLSHMNPTPALFLVYPCQTHGPAG